MEVQAGRFYRHFKGGLYQVLNVAVHTETAEKLVIYQALYGVYEVYARPLDSFTEMLSRDKYPESSQKYRFEEVSKEELLAMHSQDLKSQIEAKFGKQKLGTESSTNSFVQTLNNVSKDEPAEISLSAKRRAQLNQEAIEAGVSPVLLLFLDAETSEQKLDIIKENYMDIDERTLTNIEASLDVIGNAGSLDDRIRYVCDNLRTKAKYENMRLR